ncbi:MAG: AI-2E family transporter [Planctomycetia bacterium]|nr:AI-2E family transporter [Planctomycetia bacterium]
MNPESSPTPTRPWRDPGSVQIAAQAILAIAAGWWLLGQFASVLRPLLIAVFLCYVLLPTYSRLRRKQVPVGVAVGLLAGSAIVVLLLVALFAYGNVLSLAEEGPQLQSQAIQLFQDAHRAMGGLPDWLANDGAKRPEEFLAGKMPQLLQGAANLALGGLIEAAVAGLYLLFLLLGAERLPARVRAAYPPERAEQLLHVAGRINSAIISYLKAKCLSSLVFAIPVWLVLALCGVKFAVLWAVLTFVCNFIPYIGSVVAYGMPTAFAILQFGGSPWAFAVAAALLGIHLVCAMLIEPLLIGRAVGLSPLVVLAALAVWGLVWGLPGMVLAVPLTVVAKIAMENIDATRPIAKLVAE